MTRKFKKYSITKLSELVHGESSNLYLLRRIRDELGFRTTRAAKRLRGEVDSLLERESTRSAALAVQRSAPTRVARRARNKGPWKPGPETPEAVWVDLRSRTSAYDRQELKDLGLPQDCTPFREDLTAEDFRQAEEVFDAALPRIELDWWDTSETRSRAAWLLLQRGEDGRRRIGRWDGLLAALGYGGILCSDHPLTLAELTSVPQVALEDWRAGSGDIRGALSVLSIWIDEPEYDVASFLKPRIEPVEILADLQSELKKTERVVIQERYGLGELTGKTLDQVAFEVGVTRERIRQIQVRALKRLKSRVSVDLAKWFLSAAAQRISPEPAQRVDEDYAIRFIRSRFTAEEALIWDLGHVSRNWMIEQCGTRIGDTVLLGARIADHLLASAETLDLEQFQGRLPCARALFERRSPALSALPSADRPSVIAASTGLALQGDYVLPADAPAAMTHAVELHERLLNDGGYVQIGALGRRRPVARGAAPSRDYGRQDVDAFVDFPHLFMKMVDDAILVLGEEVDWCQPRKPAPPRDGRDWLINSESVAGRLIELVGDLGVARLSQIKEEVYRRYGSAIAEGSIHGVISGRPDLFLRVSPGTYCLHGTDLAGFEDQLTEPFHVKHFLAGREAGEELGAYAAWTPSMEHRWCKWARANDQVIYRALLHHASIDAWPLDDSKLEWWRGERSRAARPRSPKAAPDTYAPMPLDMTELFEMICMARLDRGINQLRVNRSLGLRPGVRSAWSYLAVLVAVGWLDGQEHWQSWHPLAGDSPDGELADVFGEMMDERSLTGANAAESPAARRLCSLAMEGLRDGRCEWLTPNMRSALTNVLTHADAVPSAPCESPDDYSIEDALRSMSARRAMEQLLQLGEDDGFQA